MLLDEAVRTEKGRYEVCVRNKSVGHATVNGWFGYISYLSMDALRLR